MIGPLRLFLVATSLLTSGALSQEPTYDLLWKPKGEDVLDYALSLHIDVDQYLFVYRTGLHLKVLKVKENGDYELETSTRDTKIKFGDEDEMSPSEEPAPTIETFNARGERVSKDAIDEEEDGPDPVGKILGEVTDFSVPDKAVAKGEKWAKDVTADKDKKRDAARLEYEVVGLEGDDADPLIRIDYKYRQTEGSQPVTAAGTYRLKRSDFSIQSFEADVEHFKMDDDAPAGTARLEMKRVASDGSRS